VFVTGGEFANVRGSLPMTQPDSVSIRPFRAADQEAVVALWHACDLVRPWNDPHKDIARKLRVHPEWFLVAEIDGEIVGTVMVGYEGHRGWINYLAVHPSRQRGGVGRNLMIVAEGILRDAGCPKINLMVRRTNAHAVAFYERLGFSSDDVVTLGKRLEHDEPAWVKAASPAGG
jgi:ribosomal protein S18 acetylase RimI-like enzyme